MKLTEYSRRIPEIYGTLTTVALIAYFFLIYAIGYVYITELRILNLFIQGAGIYLAIRQFKNTHDGHLNYFRGMAVGIATSFIASSTFVLFLFIYLYLDHNLMSVIKEHGPLGEFLNPYIATFTVWLEGIFSGFMATFILINFIDTDKA